MDLGISPRWILQRKYFYGLCNVETSCRNIVTDSLCRHPVMLVPGLIGGATLLAHSHAHRCFQSERHDEILLADVASHGLFYFFPRYRYFSFLELDLC